MIRVINKIYTHFLHDSLYRNSLYIMASSLAMSFFGFVFWIINARLYTTTQIGLATTLISITQLISNFSLFGLNQSLIKYLPKSDDKNAIINTILEIIIGVTIIISIIYLLGISFFSPQLTFITTNPFFIILFIIFMIFTSLNLITDSVFIAYRAALYILIIDVIYSLVKMILPVFFIHIGMYGIFLSYIIGIIIAMLLSFLYMFLKLNYHPFLYLKSDIIKKISVFSVGSYIAIFLGNFPAMFLPIIIVNVLGPKQSAFYYIDATLAGMLYFIPTSISQALFAEGSHNEADIFKHLKRSVKFTTLLLIPAIIIYFLVGKYILLAFGKTYSDEGFRLLQYFSISAVFIAINNICGTLFKFINNIRYQLYMGVISVVLVLGLSYFFLSKGLLGIGFAWIIGYGITALIGIAIAIYLFKTDAFSKQ